MYRRFFLIICALTLSLGLIGSAVAQKQKPPEGGKPKPFTIPHSDTIKLDNGLVATLVPYGTLPKVSISVVVRAGNLNETAEQVWLADLMGQLMKEGTTTRNAEAIAQDAARMGGDVNIAVSEDQTILSSDVLSEFGPDMIGLLADLIQKPLFPSSELPRLKNDFLRRLTISKSQPGPLAQERFRKLLYPNHAYGRLFPTDQMIERYTIEDVTKFYKENFGAARTHIFIAGRFDPEAMKKAVRHAFGEWARGADPVFDIPKPVTARTINLIDRPGAAQSTLYIGLPTLDPSNPDFVPFLVMNSLLGGSFSSRITSNIREQKGYTYSPSSQVSTRYRDGYWVEVADVTTAVTGPSMKEIFAEIERLQKEAPTEEELTGTKNFLAGNFVRQNSSRGGVMGQLIFLNLHGLDEKYLTNYVQNVYAVTPQDIQRIAQKYIRSEKMTIVVVGDREKIAQQISPFGEVAN